jgi:hypothetical protein
MLKIVNAVRWVEKFWRKSKKEIYCPNNPIIGSFLKEMQNIASLPG